MICGIGEPSRNHRCHVESRFYELGDADRFVNLGISISTGPDDAQVVGVNLELLLCEFENVHTWLSVHRTGNC